MQLLRMRKNRSFEDLPLSERRLYHQQSQVHDGQENPASYKIIQNALGIVLELFTRSNTRFWLTISQIFERKPSPQTFPKVQTFRTTFRYNLKKNFKFFYEISVWGHTHEYSWWRSNGIFFGFGYVKQQIGRRKARTIEGIWKHSKEIWYGVDQDLVNSVFSSSNLRLRLITKINGEHIEHTNAFHYKKINL